MLKCKQTSSAGDSGTDVPRAKTAPPPPVEQVAEPHHPENNSAIAMKQAEIENILSDDVKVKRYI